MLTLTAQVVVGYLGRNKVASDALPELIGTVHAALSKMLSPPVVPLQQPAVPIKASIQPDHLVCLEDGAKMRQLTRYLRRFDLTPETYRAKWGLPRDYPMMPPGLAAMRSASAKQAGFGKIRRKAAAAAPMAVVGPGEDRAETDAIPASHTAASVFANFPGAPEPEAVPAAAQAGKPGRKRFAQQSMRHGRRMPRGG